MPYRELRKDAVIQIRTSVYKKDIIKKAAILKDTSVSQFVVNAAYQKAKEALGTN